MLEPNGTIVLSDDARITRSPYDGSERCEYDMVWQGGPIARLPDFAYRRIRDDLGREPHRGEVVALGRYRVRLVVTDTFRWDWIVARDGARARIYERVYPLVRSLRTIKTRLIWTAGVWGCADIQYGAIPRWRDLRWPRRRPAKRKA